MTGAVNPAQPVMQRQSLSRTAPLEQIGFGQTPQWPGTLDQTYIAGVGQEDPHGYFGTTSMAAEYRERLSVAPLMEQGGLGEQPGVIWSGSAGVRVAGIGIRHAS
jgi:hypothetical protein